MKREELVSYTSGDVRSQDRLLGYYFYIDRDADKVMDAMEAHIKELESEAIGYKASLARADFRLSEKNARIKELEVENSRLTVENVKLKTFNRGDFEEFAAILERHAFFCQRAGYELWLEKPKDVQDKDIEDRNRDYARMKFLLHRFHEELVSVYTNAEFWKGECKKLKEQAAKLNSAGWHTVADGDVPATCEFVKAKLESGRQLKMKYANGNWFDSNEFFYDNDEDPVTHWRPYPPAT